MDKKRKTHQENKLAAAQNGTKHSDTWSSAELKKLLKAVKACGKRWKDVAAAVGSRNEGMCKEQYRSLKKAGRLEPISETTPLRPLIFSGFTKSAFNKCITKIDGKNITTVGELAALDLDVSKLENKIYLMKLTGKKGPSPAVDMAAPWKAKAIEALAFWQ